MKPTYEPRDIESRWYPVWEQAGAFRPEVNPDGEPFSIVIPPPNVTGRLHMGHALNMSVQDVIIRRKRMQGFAALWLPGTDHAGIATQNVVERELANEGLTRHDLGRERFVEQVWAWKARSGDLISQQIRTMGFSTDWSRERFTLDDGLSRAVRRVFVTLYEQGLIYRGNRIINWCPRCSTALSDIEVEHEDEVGELAYVRYPFLEGEGGITVATTRLETMLGDTGVAVHPDDERYRAAVGRTVVLPLLGREIPVVADSAVDPEFGTGAVKVTPAHDPIDFEIAARHDLPPVLVIDIDGRITKEGGDFFGQDRFEAREAVRHELKRQGYLERADDHHYSVGHCSRCGTVVEPLLSLQWFVRVSPLAGPAIERVKDGSTRYVPDRWAKDYFHWMENLRDWTVSRQLWWGHRIPVWYCDDCDEVIVAMEAPASCPGCEGSSLTQEEDVLDTWFSSALWPFSTLGWPEDSADLAAFYPTTALVTAYDIITFWVSRMLMMGLHFLDEVPFGDVVIHGLVRDRDGRKMSKSLGNALDPLELVDKYGADPVRLALVQAAAPGHDIPLQEDWIDAARRFGNKLWNALRFAVEHVGVTQVAAIGDYPETPGPEDAWILQRLNETAGEVERLMDEYRFSDATSLLRTFAWAETFDWYLEMAKTPLKDSARAETTKQTLGVVLRDILKFFHPTIPFVTEELWSHLGDGSLLITASWPDPPAVKGPASMDEFQELTVAIRRFRAEHDLPRRQTISVLLDDPVGITEDWWQVQLQALAAAEVTTGAPPERLDEHTRITVGSLQAFISLAGLVDAAAERPRLEKAVAAIEAQLQGARAKLANPDFRTKAPAAVVEKEEAKVSELEGRLHKLNAQLEGLGNAS